MLPSAILAVGLCGCGGGGSSSGGSSGAAVNVALSQNTATVQAGATQNVIATVTNDDSNKGVTWTVSCSSIPCGSVSPAFTPSGTPATYTPPVTLPAADLSVTLTATSVADPAKSANAAITVPQLPGFAGVSEAHVDKVNGMARLIINGKPAPPLVFMYQEDSQMLQFLAPQAQDAMTHGIHLYSIQMQYWPWDNQGTAPLDFSSADQLIDNVTRVDPQAVLLLNLGVAAGDLRSLPRRQTTFSISTASQMTTTTLPWPPTFMLAAFSPACPISFNTSKTVPTLLTSWATPLAQEIPASGFPRICTVEGWTTAQ